MYLPLAQASWIVGYVFTLNDINSTGLSWIFAILCALQVCTNYFTILYVDTYTCTSSVCPKISVTSNYLVHL